MYYYKDVIGNIKLLLMNLHFDLKEVAELIIIIRTGGVHMKNYTLNVNI